MVELTTPDPVSVYELYTDDPDAPTEGWMVKAECPDCGMLDHDETVYALGHTGDAERRRCEWCGRANVRIVDTWPVRLHRAAAEAEGAER